MRNVTSIAALVGLTACNVPITQLSPHAGTAAVRAGKASGLTGRLLFLADRASNSVFIYTLPHLRLVKTVTGFEQVGGECADSSGDIWVTDTRAHEVINYSRAGEKQRTLTLPAGQYPLSCAVSPSGDLAVVVDPYGVGYAMVTIYPGSTGTPFSINDPQSNAEAYFYDSYDSSNNLYFDAIQRYIPPRFALWECSAPCTANSSVKSLSISGAATETTSPLEWDDRLGELLIEGQSCEDGASSCVYRYDTHKQQIEGVTELKSADNQLLCTVGEAALNERDHAIIGAAETYSSSCRGNPSTLYRWQFPSGSALRSKADADQEPVGAAISPPMR